MLAFWTKVAAFEVDWDWSLLMAAMTGLGPRGEAGAPAGHGVGLGEAAEDDDVVFGLGDGGSADGRAEEG